LVDKERIWYPYPCFEAGVLDSIGCGTKGQPLVSPELPEVSVKVSRKISFYILADFMSIDIDIN
jgi:hypothetical protein